MKINLGKLTIKVNLVALYRAYKKLKRLIKKWRKDNVLEEETADTGGVSQ